MTKKIDGLCYKNMIEYGVQNLNVHRTLVNHINVFPVPDGDTGTNMVVTIKNGLSAINDSITNLASVSQKFAKSVVSGARGNSGVIASQFLKGISETLSGFEYADAETFLSGLEHGVKCAYNSVSEPVEGTILTVVKTATEATRRECDSSSDIDDIIDVFIKHAKIALENTPELLPQLKEAGVVDSGGSGIVYFFEGMKKYLDGEKIAAPEPAPEKADAVTADLSAFGKNSSFPYGYCTEFLLQLLEGSEEFSYPELKTKLGELGNSIVTSFDDGRVKVHVHTFSPEKVLALCHRYGEFLTLKIENMTVQHTEIAPRVMYSKDAGSENFSVVAVAPTEKLQKIFLEMGADAVIRCEKSVTQSELCEVFDRLHSKKIIVFPNGKRSLDAAENAKRTYGRSEISVIGSKSAAECYAALPMTDYAETDVKRAASSLEKIVGGIYTAKIIHRKNPLGDRFGDYVASDEKDVIAVGSTLTKALETVFSKAADKCESGIATVFVGGGANVVDVRSSLGRIASLYEDTEINTVETDETSYDVMISFE